MDIDKMDLFLDKVLQHFADLSPVLEFFKEEWPKFNKDEREILKNIIDGISLRIAENVQIPTKIKLEWSVMLHYCAKPVIDGKIIEEVEEDIFPKLTLGQGIKANQITKIFQRLRINGYITSSWDQIAEAISIILPVEYTTAYNDLTDSKRLKNISLPPL
jgi:hypothetical protein